jgi:cation diffusion facilitator family transporter
MTDMIEDTGRPKKERSFLATKETASKLAIIAISLLIAVKVAASIVTGSVGIRADAIHSLIDLLGAVVGFFGIRISGRPPDEQHAFGHGKAENIAGVVIAALIFVAAGTIVYEAVRRIVDGGTVELVAVGIYVTAAAIVINAIVSWYVLRISRSTDSTALDATAHDMIADAMSSCAVLIGLVLVWLTGLSILDAIVALFIALLIARTAYLTMKRPLGDLMDTRLPEAEEGIITSCIMEHSSMVVGFHALRTRKSGSHRYIDLHLVMPKEASVDEAHDACDHLEHDIGMRLDNACVTIHIEPCTVECDNCRISCTIRKKN